jgi:hypothetical protein
MLDAMNTGAGNGRLNGDLLLLMGLIEGEKGVKP